MRERPILFNGAMVRAILAGQKTQTRRLVKGSQIPKEDPAMGETRRRWSAVGQRDARYGFCVFGETEDECAMELGSFGTCPYGRPGDRLWVRETWMDLRGTGIEHRPTPDSEKQRYAYGADSPPGSASDEARKDYGLKWRPSIHMPRAACRILLEVVSVRVEHLQDISESDARAEGTDASHCFHDGGYCKVPEPYKTAFAGLWAGVYGADNWRANPWVWVVEFRRVQP